MAKIVLTFEGESWKDVVDEIEALLAKTVEDGFPDDEPEPEPEPTPEPDPAPEPRPAPRSNKKTRPAAPPPPPPPVAPVQPEPELPPALKRDLPPVETLKYIVTQAVRLAQKKEGPGKILELLPDFKAKTGLGFVMEAEDKHREALADLIAAAGLETV